VVNIFQTTYETRLRSWYDLRKTLESADIQTKCVEIDRFWQSAPLVSHHLHPNDIDSWPGPWDLIADNTYCEIARGLGMIYTLLSLGVTDIDFCLAINDNSEEVSLVLVDNAKYVMNYWPDTVLNNKSTDFNIKEQIDIDKIKTIIGETW
jgi:hypothetical protein